MTGRCEAWQWGTLSEGPYVEWDFRSAYCQIGVECDVPTQLLGELSSALPDMVVESTAEKGLDPDFVEAIAFAWLAREFVARRAGNLASVTGARGARVLGAFYPGANPESD